MNVNVMIKFLGIEICIIDDSANDGAKKVLTKMNFVKHRF